MNIFRLLCCVCFTLLLFGCYDEQATSLGGAASNGELDKVKQLIEQGANINGCVGYEGCERPIDFAARKGHLDVIKYLVDHGAEINASPINAVFWAARYGKADIIHYLLSKGGHLVCDKSALVSLKREMTQSGWAELEAEVEKTWVAP